MKHSPKWGVPYGSNLVDPKESGNMVDGKYFHINHSQTRENNDDKGKLYHKYCDYTYDGILSTKITGQVFIGGQEFKETINEETVLMVDEFGSGRKVITIGNCFTSSINYITGTPVRNSDGVIVSFITQSKWLNGKFAYGLSNYSNKTYYIDEDSNLNINHKTKTMAYLDKEYST